jgi:hypothetical protein
MTKARLPHWITKNKDIIQPGNQDNLYEFLVKLVELNPSIEKYIFSREGSECPPVFSTAIWLNDQEIPLDTSIWKNTPCKPNDNVDIEPAIVGG